MRLEYQSKTLEYDNSNIPIRTRVMLGNADGASVPIFLSPDKIDLPKAELYHLAMEQHYQDNFPQRAENEKFNLMGERIAKYDEMVEEMQQALDESKDSTTTALETINQIKEQMTAQVLASGVAQSTLISIISTFYAKGLLTDDDLEDTGTMLTM